MIAVGCQPGALSHEEDHPSTHMEPMFIALSRIMRCCVCGVGCHLGLSKQKGEKLGREECGGEA